MTIFDGSVPPRIQAIAIFGSIALMVFVIQLIRRGKLKEGYSIIWFVMTSLMIFFSLFTSFLSKAARSLGIAYVPAALFLILIFGIILLCIHFSVLFSHYERRMKELAQEHAILKHKLESQQN